MKLSELRVGMIFERKNMNTWMGKKYIMITSIQHYVSSHVDAVMSDDPNNFSNPKRIPLHHSELKLYLSKWKQIKPSPPSFKPNSLNREIK